MNGVSSRAPTILRTIAVVGVVVAVVGTIVIWVFLSDLEETSERSLLIGEQATVTLTETIDIAAEVLEAVDGGLVTVQDTLGTIDDVLRSTAEVAGAVGSLSSTLPTSLEAVDSGLATLEGLATTVDDALNALSSVPFGPDYDPDVPFPEAVAQVRSALVPISENLSTVSTELQNFSEGSDSLTAEIDSFVADVERTRDALTGTDALLVQYREAAAEAGELAAQTRNDLESSMVRMRLVLLALGLLLALSQFVPWTLAAVLDADRRPRETLTTDVTTTGV